MNSILQLKGQFNLTNKKGGAGPRNLPARGYVESTHIEKLISELESIQKFWINKPLIQGALVSVLYVRVIAKSNRIKALLSKGCVEPSDATRGVRFEGEGDDIKHVITYYVSLDAISETISVLNICHEIIEKEYDGKIAYQDIDALHKNANLYPYQRRLAKSRFINAIIDAFYVEKFFVDQIDIDENESAIVSIYKTDVSTKKLFESIGIDYLNVNKLSEDTFLMQPDDLAILKRNAPYLASMSVRDIREIPVDTSKISDPRIAQIPKPENEPIVGVIDTPFYKDVYFGEWVTYENMIDNDIELTPEDFDHGTKVTSIIVDGPSINPDLDDGCGRFRVKHFGVAKGSRFSSCSVLRSIREAVTHNTEIKVWNISLGSVRSVNRNFISPEAAELDKIQNEFDVVFVIAGTNSSGDRKEIRIGAPADSLNSVVVNSVKTDGTPASYHRIGPVLSFFRKPDISCYGGDTGQEMRVCAPTGESYVKGTSFSAPWIARKMAYLIYTMGFTREVAKALIIDAAAGWQQKIDTADSVGYGVVPRRINEIVETAEDEIKFVISGTADAYETYTYNIPIPIHNAKQPFYARATLCYFPKCVREQGVDYTSTEMDIHFGRVKEINGRATIDSLDRNPQDDEGGRHLYESEARKLYRKWDNVKVICDKLKTRVVPRKVYGIGMWGLSIKTKERLKDKNGRGLPFGVVVTLKEMYGKNRIDEFIKLCEMRGWIVNRLDIEFMISVYDKAEAEIEF